MPVLDQIAENQQDKEVTANENFEAAQPSSLFGRHASACAALTWGFYGGKFLADDGSIVDVASGTLALTASQTNYVEAHPTTGVVSVNIVGFTAGRLQLYQIVAGAATVTSYTDKRTFSMHLTPGAGVRPYIVSSAFNGAIPGYTYVFRHVVPDGVTWSIAAGFVGSKGFLKSGPADSMSFPILKNGVQIGTLNFAPGSPNNFGSFTVASAQSLSGGDVLEFYLNQSGPDVSASDLGITVKGTF